MHAFALVLQQILILFVLGRGLKRLVLERPVLQLVLRRVIYVSRLVGGLVAQVAGLRGIGWAQESGLLDLFWLFHDQLLALPNFRAHAALSILIAARAVANVLDVHLQVHSVPFVAEGLRHVLVLVEAHGVGTVLAHVVTTDIVDVLLLLQFIQPVLLGGDHRLLRRPAATRIELLCIWIDCADFAVVLYMRGRRHHLRGRVRQWYRSTRGRLLLLLLLMLLLQVVLLYLMDLFQL